MIKRIFFALLVFLLVAYAIAWLFFSGFLLPHRIKIENYRIETPSEFVVSKVFYRNKFYNLFELPFIKPSLKLTDNIDDLFVTLENFETHEVIFLNFAKYSRKKYAGFLTALSEMDKYTLDIKNKCKIIKWHIPTHDIGMYVYKKGLIVRYSGRQDIGDYLIEQVCKR